MKIRYIERSGSAIKARHATGAARPTGAAGRGTAEPKKPAGQTDSAAVKGPAESKGLTGIMDRIRMAKAMGAAAATGETGAAAGSTEFMGRAGAPGAVGPIGSTGPMGATGPTGETGAMGPMGPAGATGPTGETGPAGARGSDGGYAIIPFASGSPITMTTMAGGLAGLPGLIAFGTSAQGTAPLGSSIDLSGLPGLAFPLPRAGTVTSLTAFFSTTAPLTLAGTTVSVTAQLYEAAPSGNIFTPIPGASVPLSPPCSGTVHTGLISSGLTEGLSAPIAAGTRLLMVFYITAAGAALIHTVSGYASGGLAIA